eukprot:Gb_32700 [translate_table: standard]
MPKVSVGEANKGGLNPSSFKKALMLDFVKPMDIVMKEDEKRFDTLEGKGLNTMEKGSIDQGEFPLNVSLDENEWVLDKNMWYNGKSLIKAIPWALDVDVASLKKNSEVRWMEIKGRPCPLEIYSSYNRPLPEELRVFVGHKLKLVNLVVLGGLDGGYFSKKMGYIRNKCPELFKRIPPLLDEAGLAPLITNPVFEKLSSLSKEVPLDLKAEVNLIELNDGTHQTWDEEQISDVSPPSERDVRAVAEVVLKHLNVQGRLVTQSLDERTSLENGKIVEKKIKSNKPRALNNSNKNVKEIKTKSESFMLLKNEDLEMKD